MSKITAKIMDQAMVPTGAVGLSSDWINVRSFPVFAVQCIVGTGPMAEYASSPSAPLGPWTHVPTGDVGGQACNTGVPTGYVRFSMSNEDDPAINQRSGETMIANFIHYPVDSGVSAVPVVAMGATITNFNGYGSKWLRIDWSSTPSAACMTAWITMKGGIP